MLPLDTKGNMHKFTHVPFQPSNTGSNFCYFIEQLLEDQWFVILLLYLSAICISALDIDTMLDGIEMVFTRVESFQFKIIPKKCHFFQSSVVFWAMFSLWMAFQSIYKRWVKLTIGLYLRMWSSYTLFLV